MSAIPGLIPDKNEERQWKIHGEKQKAKLEARAKRLEFPRPVSAAEPWRRAAAGGGRVNRRPLSAGFQREVSFGRTSSEAATADTLAQWRLPSEGEGDGIVGPRKEGLRGKDGEGEDGERRGNTFETATVAPEDQIEDIEDVHFADRKTLAAWQDGSKEEETKETQEETEEAAIIEVAQLTDALFTPLIPYTHEDESDEEKMASIKPPKSEAFCFKTCDDETDDDDDDERENEVEAATEAQKTDDKADEMAEDNSELEKEAEEHLRAMKGRQEEFMMQPIPQKLRRAFQCRLTRKDAGFYELCAERPSGDKIVLMTAKRKKGATTVYAIFGGGGLFHDEDEDVFVELGGVKANLLGTNFTVFRNLSHPRRRRGAESAAFGIESELAVITYEPNILGLKGPRRVGVVIPGMTEDGSRVGLRSKDQYDSIVARMKNNAASHLIKMENKIPTWNDRSQSFVLNFRGRVTKASVKNFQIVHARDPDYIVFQFGRVSDDEFTLDFRYPLCPLQAFGCALSSMSRKLACE